MKKRKLLSLAVSGALAVSLLATAGCQFISKLETPSAETSTTAGQTSPVTVSNPAVTIPVAGTSQPLPSIADVVAAVKPSVVQVNTETTVMGFFNRQQTESGAGSGWIIRSDGYIITNNHVIDGATSVSVQLDDGRTLPVDVSKIAADAVSDIAVLKVDATGLPAVKIGDSTRLRVGDWVVAIGNSLGEGVRATLGIVSMKDATIQDPNGTGQDLYGLIETDAAINPGNSGGPLVDLSGQVVGITNAKYIATGVEGAGFAISMNQAIPIIEELMSKGYVTRPYLGIQSYTVDSTAIIQLGLKVNKGALLLYVEPGSPAARAGLQRYDVVTGFAGKAITSSAELLQAIFNSKIGQQVEIVYYRGSSQLTTTAVLIEKPR